MAVGARVSVPGGVVGAESRRLDLPFGLPQLARLIGTGFVMCGLRRPFRADLLRPRRSWRGFIVVMAVLVLMDGRVSGLCGVWFSRRGEWRWRSTFRWVPHRFLVIASRRIRSREFNCSSGGRPLPFPAAAGKAEHRTRRRGLPGGRPRSTTTSVRCTCCGPTARRLLVLRHSTRGRRLLLGGRNRPDPAVLRAGRHVGRPIPAEARRARDRRVR